MIGMFKLLLMKTLLIFSFGPSKQQKEVNNDSTSAFREVPVLGLNFYMMGRDEASSQHLTAIRDNVEYLNSEFEGRIKFEIGHLFVDDGYALLPDLHQEYFGVEELTVDSLVENIESKGSINVFIFDSYVVEEVNSELMGFTPIFRAEHKEYVNASPSFDRIFLAYNALKKQSTLVHEMGHFLGLDHPWQMNEVNKVLLGLDTEQGIEKNHMAYGVKVDHFTAQQLDRMWHFAIRFRSYLFQRTEYHYGNGLVSYNSN